jgi:hypothetical protein
VGLGGFWIIPFYCSVGGGFFFVLGFFWFGLCWVGVCVFFVPWAVLWWVGWGWVDRFQVDFLGVVGILFLDGCGDVF